MRRRTFLAAGIAGTLTAAAAAAELLQPWRRGSQPTGTNLGSSTTSTTVPAVQASASGPVARWVVAENAKVGSSNWNLARVGSGGQLEGYASTVSATVGETVGLYVSTVFPAFRVEAYRMGFYGGLGARLVWSSRELRGVMQGPPTFTPGINMVEARWQRTAELTIDRSFPPGVYLLKLVSPTGVGHWIPLTVRDDSSTAAYVLKSSVATWQAYNLWGGYSLYGHGHTGAGFAQRSRVVSFDRPYDGAGGADFPGLELPLVMLVEQLGLDVTYTTDLDVHAHPERLLGHKMFCSLGHDEYWSKPMRDGVEVARDHGVNLAFFGANAAYRQIRLEPSPLGPDRHQVCYKSAAEDPIRTTNPSLTTVNWRAAPVSRPESEMIGQQYACNPVFADMVIVDPTAWVFQGTNAVAGQRLPDVIGSEYDRYHPAQTGPPNVQVLAHSPVTCHNRPSYSNMTYYSAPSGAGVFATGTINWLARITPQATLTAPRFDPVVLRVTKNILAAFGAGPAGHAHPSVPNYNLVSRG